jgi:hypothetical protein
MNNNTPKLNPNNVDIATIKTGQDGNKWIVIDDSKGIKSWIKIGTKVKTYTTSYNRIEQFKVVILKNKILVFKNIYVCVSHKDKSIKCPDVWKLSMTLNDYINIFVGKNTKKYAKKNTSLCTGNTLLIEMKKNSYLLISNNVKTFTTLEPIKKYHSVVDNSDVPHPFAISDNYIYILEEYGKYTDRVKGDPNPIESFRGNNIAYNTKFKNIKFKVII